MIDLNGAENGHVRELDVACAGDRRARERGLDVFRLDRVGVRMVTGKINLKTMEKTSKFVVVFLKVVEDMQKVGSDQTMYDMFRNSAEMLTGTTGYIQTMTDIMTALQKLPAGAGKINLVTMKKIGEFIECGMLPAVQHIGNIPTVISDKVSQVSEAMTMFTNLSDTISGKSFATAVKIGINKRKIL